MRRTINNGMNKDNHLIMEALHSKFTQSQGTDTYALNQLEKMIGALEGMSTAIHLSKSSAVDQQLSRLRDTVEMLMSERGSGTSENAEGPVKIDRVSASDIIKPVSQQSGPVKIDWGVEDDENASGASAAFHYDPMPGLDKTAHKIRDLLQGAANDEARTEHIIKMAQIILGSPKDYDPNEYRKMLDGLIVLLNRFIVVPMN